MERGNNLVLDLSKVSPDILTGTVTLENAVVSKMLTVKGGLDVSGDSTTDNQKVANDLTVGNDAAVQGDLTLSGAIKTADGSAGNNGQVLSSTGSNTAWIDVASDRIIDADANTQIQVEEGANDNTIRFDANGVEVATMTETKMTLNTPINAVMGTSSLGNLNVTGALRDSSGDTGSAGQLLFTTANGTNWVNPPSVSSTRIEDADSNTFIDVEATTDANEVSVTVSGTQHFVMKAGGRLDVLNSGSSVFIGENAGANDDLSSNNNVAIGTNALISNVFGDNNVANGYQAIWENSTGKNNIAIGVTSLYDNNTGDNNTALGYNTGRGITTGSNNTIIGANVQNLSNDLSNTVIIADGDGNERIYVDNQGNMGLGTTAPTETLTVNGTAAVSGNATVTGNLEVSGDLTKAGAAYTQPDYVFEKYFEDKSDYNTDYQMLSLSELETFMKTNKHLPGVQSRAEIEEKGHWNVTENVRTNLEKVEELFLHTLEQEKKIEAQEARLQAQEKEIEALKIMIKKIAENTPQ